MPKGVVKDVTNDRFGKLTAMRRVDNSIKGNAMWLCACDCGNEKVVMGTKLRNGHTKSCGCINRERIINKNKSLLKHGDVKTRLYGIWHSMKQRCLNNNVVAYKYYGGKGVKVCSDWLSYVLFKEWALSSGYTDNLTIDRIDNDGDYAPENCQWLTKPENTRKANANRGFKINN